MNVDILPLCTVLGHTVVLRHEAIPTNMGYRNAKSCYYFLLIITLLHVFSGEYKLKLFDFHFFSNIVYL